MMPTEWKTKFKDYLRAYAHLEETHTPEELEKFLDTLAEQAYYETSWQTPEESAENTSYALGYMD